MKGTLVTIKLLANRRQNEYFPGGMVVKNLPAVQEVQEMWVRSLGQEGPLEQEMAWKMAWKIPWTEEPSGLQSMGLQRTRYNWANEHTHTHEYVTW